MSNFSEIVLQKIERVQKVPSMYVTKPCFDAISNFFVGYFSALEDVTNIPYNHDISIWINRKKRTSLLWTAYIFHVLAKKDADKAYSLIFSELKAFFEANIVSPEAI
ncbi:MAG: hypothetical protein JNM36_14460 [Chitinophagales bacterium]|nr:hypothetical protein [Chitinophagales bacterium]